MKRGVKRVNVFKAPLYTIREGKFKVRIRLDPCELSKLRDSIRKQGDVINPIPVRLLPDGTFEALGGHRRLQAAREACLKEVSVRVFKVESEAEAWRIAYHEDALKEPWSPIAKALAFKRMREDGISLQDIAVMAGMSEERVNRIIRLLELPEPVKSLIDSGKLSIDHGIELLRLKDKGELTSLAVKAAEELWSVQKLRAEVENVLKSTLKEAKIELIPAKGAQKELPTSASQIEEIPAKEAKIEEISKPEKPEVAEKPMERVVPIKYAYTTCPECGQWVEIAHMSDGSHKLKMVKGTPYKGEKGE
jgi:ParB family chromosome partitioning protein